MRSPPIRKPYRPNTGCQLLFKSDKIAGIFMAIPFVVCFALFGIFNLIAGTVLTTVACRRKLPPKTLRILEKLQKEQLIPSADNFLDPMKVVGIILLITGSLLVFVGVLLGIVACRSANFESRRRSSCASYSGFPASSAANGLSTFRQLSGRLKVRLSCHDDPMSFASVRTSTKKPPPKILTTTVDIHRSNDIESSVSDIDDHQTTSEVPDEINTIHKRTYAIVWSGDVHSSSRSLSDFDNSSTRSPIKKACSVTWATSVTKLESKTSSETFTE